MGHLLDLARWVSTHWADVSEFVVGTIAVAEVATRLTPTKTDDGFVQRLGAGIKYVLDALRFPQVRR